MIFLKNFIKTYQISSGGKVFGKVFLLSGSGDGGMMTGTGMELDLPGGTWSLDSFLRGGTGKKINIKTCI